MGKVKSAIITVLLVAAVIVLALFATISCGVPGSDGVKRYNSFLSMIPLGGDITGEATAVIYPEGVISDSDYNYVVSDEDENNKEKREKYLDKYLSKGSLWIDKEKLGDDDGKAFAESVKNDAEIISDRLSRKGYTGYSVTVVDGYAIRLTIPAGFSYSAYKNYDVSARSEALSDAGHAVNYLTLAGKLDLRDGTDYDSSNSLISIKEDFNSYIKSASAFSRAGTDALRIDLTNEGFDKLNSILTAGDSNSSAYIYVGETNVQLTFTMGTALSDKSLYFQASKSYSEDYAILIDSVAKGARLQNNYNDSKESTATSLLAMTPAYGENAPIWLAAAVGAITLVSIIFSIIKYKRLGIVNSLIILCYALAVITALTIIGIQVTVAGVFAAVLGLALLCVSNVVTFEAVRRETSVGKTISTSVKTGYKNTLFAVLDVHVIMIIAAAIMALVGVGELAACGLIFFIGAIASYVLYWFTRFMWYVISSPARDKFKFCGFAREVEEDD